MRVSYYRSIALYNSASEIYKNISTLFLFPVTINLLLSCLVVVQRTRAVHGRVHGRVDGPCTRVHNRVHGLYTAVCTVVCTAV